MWPVGEEGIKMKENIADGQGPEVPVKKYGFATSLGMCR